MKDLTSVLMAFGVQGLHCLTQVSDESLALTLFIKGPKEREDREEKRSGSSCICLLGLPKCGVTTPTRDPT